MDEQHPAAPHAPLRILVVCTANVCRSPVGQRALQRKLDEAGVAAIVTSAGTDAGPYKMHRHTKAAANVVGIDLEDHQPRRLIPELMASDGADLIITMTREHLYTVVIEDNDAFARTFTLPELADRVSQIDVPRGAGFAAWLGALNEGRRPNDLMPGSPHDDVADPYGHARGHHDVMVAEVSAFVTQVASSLAHAVAARAAAPQPAVAGTIGIDAPGLVPGHGSPDDTSEVERELATKLGRLSRRRGSKLSIKRNDAPPPPPATRRPTGPLRVVSPSPPPPDDAT